MNKTNKWKIGTIISIAALLTINIYVLNNEKEKIRQTEPEKVYVGHSEKISDKAYEDMINDIMNIEKIAKDEEVKKALNDLITTQENKQVNIENFNRASAVKALQDLFVHVGEDLENKDKKTLESIKDRLHLLDDEKTDIEDVLTEKTISKLYLAEEFKSDKFNRQFAASSLLIYYDIIVGNGNEEIVPIIESYDDLVYLDTRFMTAHIPLDLLIGGNTGISFEMQYVDGEWKLNPYTAMQSLNLMSILNQQGEEVKK